MENKSKFKEYAFGWVSFFLGLAGMFGLIWGVFVYLNTPTQKFSLEIQQIKSDLESHSELSKQMQNIKDNDLHSITVKLEEQQKSLIEIQKQIVKLQTLIER